MRLRFHRHTDARHALEVVRDDGGRERRELETKRPLRHDLTHDAVESGVGLDDGFFGALDAGARLDDATDLRIDAEGREATEPLQVEHVVARLQGTRGAFDATALATTLADGAAAAGVALPAWVDADALERVRARLVGVLGAWAATPYGGALELPWPAPSVGSVCTISSTARRRRRRTRSKPPRSPPPSRPPSAPPSRTTPHSCNVWTRTPRPPPCACAKRSKRSARSRTEASLASAKRTWLEGRDVLAPTEVLRFDYGPVDDPRTGFETRMSAWPLDEEDVDYVEGAPSAGIVGVGEDAESVAVRDHLAPDPPWRAIDAGSTAGPPFRTLRRGRSVRATRKPQRLGREGG